MGNIKFLFLFMFMYNVYVSLTAVCKCLRGLKRELVPLELELWVALSHSVCMLRIELRSSVEQQVVSNPKEFGSFNWGFHL